MINPNKNLQKNIIQLNNKPILKNFVYMFLFGILSLLFGMIKFYIPGIEGVASDFGEFAVLISVFHITNPLFLIGTSAIFALGGFSSGLFFTTFIIHSIALIITWYFYNFLIKKTKSIIIQGFIFLLWILIYYCLILFPLIIFTKKILGINLDKNFFVFFNELIVSFRYEMINSAFVTSLYLVQHKYRVKLKKYMYNLEDIVKERTMKLNSMIEELKTTQHYLIQKEKMASLGTLSSGIAHEINNPLNFINGGITYISNIKNKICNTESEEVNKELHSSINMIEEGLSRASNIVQTLMTFTSDKSSEIVVTDLNKVIENTILFLNYKIPSYINIIKDFNLKKKTPLHVDKIHQVIINIINNFVFELSQNKTQNPEIKISTFEKDNFAVLKISNNGKQIPEKLLTKIFDPFFTTKDPGKGVGLGLSVSFALITEHKGRIYAQNSDFGVNFIIELPLKL